MLIDIGGRVSSLVGSPHRVGESQSVKCGQSLAIIVEGDVLHDPLNGVEAHFILRGDGLGEGFSGRGVLHHDGALGARAGSQVHADELCERWVCQLFLQAKFRFFGVRYEQPETYITSGDIAEFDHDGVGGIPLVPCEQGISKLFATRLRVLYR